MSTIFSKIIAREIPAQFVYEDDVCVVVMDRFPAVQGQTLVISKQEINYILTYLKKFILTCLPWRRE